MGHLLDLLRKERLSQKRAVYLVPARFLRSFSTSATGTLRLAHDAQKFTSKTKHPLSQEMETKGV
jgi:hypothetical protein